LLCSEPEFERKFAHKAVAERTARAFLFWAYVAQSKAGITDLMGDQ